MGVGEFSLNLKKTKSGSAQHQKELKLTSYLKVQIIFYSLISAVFLINFNAVYYEISTLWNGNFAKLLCKFLFVVNTWNYVVLGLAKLNELNHIHSIYICFYDFVMYLHFLCVLTLWSSSILSNKIISVINAYARWAIILGETRFYYFQSDITFIKCLK